MKVFVLVVLSLFLGGCASHAPGRSLSTAGVNYSIGAAHESAGAAQTSLRTASEALRVLSGTALPEQKPAVARIRQSLGAAEAHLRTVSERLKESTGRAAALQSQIDAMASDLSVAQEAAARAGAGVRYWKAAAFKLGLAVLLLLLWVFRKPVLAMFGKVVL